MPNPFHGVLPSRETLTNAELAKELRKEFHRLDAENKSLKEKARSRPGIFSAASSYSGSAAVNQFSAGTGFHPVFQHDDEIGEDGISGREAREFSFCKALNASMTGRWDNASHERAMIERAATNDCDWARRKAALADVDSNLGFLVPPSVQSTLDPLRTTTVLNDLPLDRRPNLVGSPCLIPRITSDGTSEWVGTEGTAVTPAEVAADELELYPRTLASSRKFSRKLIALGGREVEMTIRRTLVASHERKREQGFFEGTGVSGQPLGLKNVSGINTVSFSGLDVGAKLIALQQMIGSLAEDSVPLDPRTCGFVMPETSWQAIQRWQLGVSTATASAILTPNVPLQWATGGSPADNWTKVLLGFPVRTSTSLVSTTGNAIYFGNWSMIGIGTWGSPTMEATQEGSTLLLTRMALVAMFEDMVPFLHHPEALCTGTAFSIT